MRRLGTSALALLLLSATLQWGSHALAHKERVVSFPDWGGKVPNYRTDGPYLVVCTAETPALVEDYPEPLRSYNLTLYEECKASGYNEIQAAIDDVAEPGTRIFVQPSRYFEKSSLEPPSPACVAINAESKPNDRILGYQQQVACPHLRNLIAIFGDSVDDPDAVCDGSLCGLQIEGTGRRPRDVVVDGRFARDNVIRADRADGFYIRNLTVEHANANALYVIETNGFAIDDVLARWNTEYGFLTFASDHGLYTACEAHGNGDSGLYPGGGATNREGFSIEITGCRAHHNLVGLAGTGGNYLNIHDNEFWDNSVGLGFDSFFPGHPGLPQHGNRIVDNRIWSNNEDFYRFWRNRTCFLPAADRHYENGVVCPQSLIPIGTGIVIAGGNENLIARNTIYAHDRYGAMLFHNPFLMGRIVDRDLATSFDNRFLGNHMGKRPDGSAADNGIADFWWDGQGRGNCWFKNSAPGGVQSIPSNLPDCAGPFRYTPPNPGRIAPLWFCQNWNPRIRVDLRGCTWSHEQRPG